MMVWSINIYAKRDDKLVAYSEDKSYLYPINRNLEFLVMCIITAMMFLGPFSLVKYAYWIIFMMILLIRKKITVRVDVIVKAYLVFLLWNLIMLYPSHTKFQGVMMLIKYSLPLLYLWLGYSAIRNGEDIIYFLKKTALVMIVYSFMLGGFPDKFVHPVYKLFCFSLNSMFLHYATLADFYASLFVVPLALFVIYGKKKWLVVAAWVLLSSVLEAVRTGIGGIVLATMLFLIFYYKMKSVPWVAGIAVLSVVIVFAVPSVRQKMFFDEDRTFEETSLSDMNFKNVRNNMREYVWDLNLNKFYKPHKLTGSGLGMASAFTKREAESIDLIHSDYVQMLCDTGLIGVVLFGVFVVTAMFKAARVTLSRRFGSMVKLTGAMAIGSCGGTFFCMAYDNVVTYSQQSFVIPFIFLGFFLKAYDIETGRVPEETVLIEE